MKERKERKPGKNQSNPTPPLFSGLRKTLRLFGCRHCRSENWYVYQLCLPGHRGKHLMRLPVPHKKGENNGPVAHLFKAQYTVCGNILAIDVQTFLPYIASRRNSTIFLARCFAMWIKTLKCCFGESPPKYQSAPGIREQK